MDSACVEFVALMDGEDPGLQSEGQQQVRLDSDEDKDDRADFGATAAGQN